MKFFTAGRVTGGLVMAFLCLFVAGTALGGKSFRHLLFNEVPVNATASVTTPFDYGAMDCDGPFALSFSSTGAAGGDFGISYQIKGPEGVWEEPEAWDGTTSGEITTSTGSGIGTHGTGLPFTPPPASPGRFSVYGVGSNPAASAFSLAVDCYRNENK
jgi:hypothetical protein